MEYKFVERNVNITYHKEEVEALVKERMGKYGLDGLSVTLTASKQGDDHYKLKADVNADHITPIRVEKTNTNIMVGLSEVLESAERKLRKQKEILKNSDSKISVSELFINEDPDEQKYAFERGAFLLNLAETREELLETLTLVQATKKLRESGKDHLPFIYEEGVLSVLYLRKTGSLGLINYLEESGMELEVEKDARTNLEITKYRLRDLEVTEPEYALFLYEMSDFGWYVYRNELTDEIEVLTFKDEDTAIRTIMKQI